MKCLILFSGKNKKNIINLSSAELAKRVVRVKLSLKMSLIFGERIDTGAVWFRSTLFAQVCLSVQICRINTVCCK